MTRFGNSGRVMVIDVIVFINYIGRLSKTSLGLPFLGGGSDDGVHLWMVSQIIIM